MEELNKMKKLAKGFFNKADNFITREKGRQDKLEELAKDNKIK